MPTDEADAETDEAAPERVLVPIEVLEATRPPEATPRLVAGMEVVILGYEHLPLQTAPDEFRRRHEEDARKRLAEIADAYRDAGAEVTERLAFVHDASRAIARAADQDTCRSVLLARPAESMDQVLVPIPGEANLSRLLDVAATVITRDGVEATLLRVTEDEDRLDEAELLVEGAEDELADRGVDADRLTKSTLLADDRLDAIAKEADGFDGLVLGEFERTLRETVFGEVHERLAGRYDGPILLVRREIEAEGPDIPEDA